MDPQNDGRVAVPSCAPVLLIAVPEISNPMSVHRVTEFAVQLAHNGAICTGFITRPSLVNSFLSVYAASERQQLCRLVCYW